MQIDNLTIDILRFSAFQSTDPSADGQRVQYCDISTVAVYMPASVHESLHKMVQPPTCKVLDLCAGQVSALPDSCCLADTPAACIHKQYCATRRSKAAGMSAIALSQTAQLKETLIVLAATHGKSLQSKGLGVQEQPSSVKPSTFEAVCETHAGSQSASTWLGEDLFSRLLKSTQRLP